jgi:hypothetical protein
MKSFLISAICCIAIVFILSFRTRIAVRLEARRRSGYSEAELLKALTDRGIPDDVSRAVAVGFRKWASAIVPDFPVKPSDRLSFYHPIVAYDYEDILDEILTASGRRWQEKRLPASLRTVEDVAHFVAGCEHA